MLSLGLGVVSLFNFNRRFILYRKFGVNGKSVISKVFQNLGNVHDIESNISLRSKFSLSSQVFINYWVHLSIIFLWASGIIFHIGWNRNYEYWIINLTTTLAHKSNIPSSTGAIFIIYHIKRILYITKSKNTLN